MQGFDCHAHVYSQVEETQESNYRPSRSAPLEEWQRHLQHCGLRGGVLVQPSFLGYDNRQLLATLAKLGPGYRGVAQLPNTTTLEEMRNHAAAGIVGVRWNLIEHRCALPDLDDPYWIDFLDRLKVMGWHLEVHLEGERLPELFPALHRHGVTVVIDHLGLPADPVPLAHEGFRQILDAGREGRTWVKLSAPYRSPVADLRPHVQALLNHLGSERLVWGSDWPWTRHENKHSYRQTYDWLRHWITDETELLTVIDSAPRQLFRLP
ncbi:hydrolase [Litchfieldella qijiaojingensis]|uniref:Hydrolase n=1 Tax=Litchfieldella qijiaojingensis TaxID=980347 RepID=A0ABQ2Z7Q8_9GAMM|nr:amidohydrolase family protein [Halomonas qijiaojingensis]GGY04017.1 hydrolase [Halomonas qijiaojingensis]